MHFSESLHPSLVSHIDELRVPVQRAEVEVHTAGGRRHAAIFLAPHASPEDVFEDELPFFPAEEGGKIRFYARSSLVSLAIGAGDAPPASLAALGVLYQARRIAVTFCTGEVLQGTLMSPSGLTRTLDLVNQDGMSFAVHAEGKIHYVAKAHVQSIEELP